MTGAMIGAMGAMGGGVSLDALDGDFIQQMTFSGGGSTSCSAGVTIRADGTMAQIRGNGVAIPNTDTEQGKYADNGAPYEVRFTRNSGDTFSGVTNGTWYALTSDRDCYLTDTGSPLRSKTCELDIDIRIGSTIVASATLDFDILIDLA